MTTNTTIPRSQRPVGIHEMVLEVRDLEVSTRFYEEIIGLKVITRWEDDRKAVWLDMGDTVALGLWLPETGGANAIANGRGGSHVHFALRIPHGSIDAVQARLQGLGYPAERVEFDVELMDAVVDWSGTPVAAAVQTVHV